MNTFLMFGKYTFEGIKNISAERTSKIVEIITNNGGKIKEMFALLGEIDLVFIVEFPEIAQAMKTSVEIAKQTGIIFTTAPALTVEKFDKLVG